MSTFTDENQVNKPKQITPPAVDELDGQAILASATIATAEDQPKKIIGDAVQTPWSTYLNSLNAKYQNKIKKAAQLSNYNLTIRYEDGREEKQVFSRMKLLQYQFDELEDLRAEATELSSKEKPRDAAKALSNMYTLAARYLLWNAKEDRPMTTEEYKHCYFSDIRPALDASMLLGLLSDPN